MTGASDINGPQTLSDEAATWVVRVQSEGATEADWLALEAWLAQSPLNRVAFDEAEALWWEYGERAPELIAAIQPTLADNVVSLNASRVSKVTPARSWRQLAAIAASIAVGMFAVWLIQPFAPAQRVYFTQVGQRQEIALADGSRVLLNSGSKLVARVDPRHRNVTLEQGEAVFDVAKDHAHPFVVAVGDQNVTVVGTEFDILRFGGRDVVTVNRGIVSVAPSHGSDGQAVRLTHGDQSRHVEGEATSDVSRVASEDVLSWRDGYVVYTNRTLAEIAKDLNRYFKVPIRIEERAAGLTFSGALRIDNEVDVVRTLEGFLPVKAVRTAKEIVIGLR